MFCEGKKKWEAVGLGFSMGWDGGWEWMDGTGESKCVLFGFQGRSRQMR